MSCHSFIEPLESRIAPAAVYVNATTATYTDEYGALATVKFSKPVLTAANVGTVLTMTTETAGEFLSGINLAGIAAATGTNITVSAAFNTMGEGVVNVGLISSAAPLGAVNIHGDLNQINAGDAVTYKTGVSSITVESFGMVALNAGDPAALSTINGPLGALIVRDNMASSLAVSNASSGHGTIGSITIGGSLFGGTANYSAYISAPMRIGSINVHGWLISGLGTYNADFVSSSIGNVTIGGSIDGTSANSGVVESTGGAIGNVTVMGSIYGSAANAGVISATTTMGNVFIGQSLQGNASEAGVIVAGKLSNVTIGGSIVGGSATDTSLVESSSSIGKVTIGGSLRGGSGSASGVINASGNIGVVKIAGDLAGGGATNANQDSGEIWSSGGSIASVTVAGSAIGAYGAYDGCILAGQNIGSVKIAGDVYSSGTGWFQIRATGTAKNEVAIGSLSFGGNVNSTLVLAGYTTSDTASNGNASIGTVTVAGNWAASSIAAGVQNTGFPYFGDSNDTVIGSPTMVSKIASIVIGGEVFGTSASGDHFGFAAQQIGSVSIGGLAVPLKAGPANDHITVGTAGDFTIDEVAPA